MGFTLFLLAHPDDDIMVRPLISRAQASGGALVAYITRAAGEQATRREKEAREALSRVGVNEQAITFLGNEIGVVDGDACSCLPELYEALTKSFGLSNPLKSIVTHAWEGGHPDHDAAHALALRFARERDLAAASVSVAYYRASASGFPPFVVQYPTPGAAGFRRLPISMGEAWAMTLAVRHYPSQWRSFVGLSPWLAVRAAFDRSLWVQPLTASVAPARPHHAPLLSETRFATPFEFVSLAASSLLGGAAKSGR